MRPRGANQTPSQYSARQKALAARSFRREIDSFDRKGSTEVHPADVVSIADDAVLEGRDTDCAKALAQIPPFKVGRSTYRVIGERTIDEGTPQERRQVALLCRTQASALHEHAAGCLCGACETYPRCWYHDATHSWHVRNPDGTFTQVKR